MAKGHVHSILPLVIRDSPPPHARGRTVELVPRRYLTQRAQPKFGTDCDTTVLLVQCTINRIQGTVTYMRPLK